MVPNAAKDENHKNQETPRISVGFNGDVIAFAFCLPCDRLAGHFLRYVRSARVAMTMIRARKRVPSPGLIKGVAINSSNRQAE